MLRVLSIITARGGSKGLPRKNCLEFNGKPLIYWTIKASLESKCISTTIVSSDDEEILSIAKNYNGCIPKKRSKDLSKDETPSVDVVLDIAKDFKKYDYVILLQPTSPLRTSNHIDEAFFEMIEKKATSITSVCLASKSPFWMFVKNKNGYLDKVISNDNESSLRQNLPTVYELNGAIYMISMKELFNKRTLITEKTIPYIMERNISLDIDYLDEFKAAEREHKKINY